MKLLSCTLALAAFLGGQADAWWDVGHGVSGAISRLYMKNPGARANLDNLLTYMQYLVNDVNGGKNWPNSFGAGTDNTLRPGQILSDIANAAIFPDIIKGFYNLQWANDWHYTNLKYDPDNLGCKDVTDFDDIKSQRNYGQMYIILYDMVTKQGMYQERTTAHWLLNFHQAFITHMIGDLHMPFHAVGRCIIDDKGVLTQDQGGNKWEFYYPKAGGGTTKTNQHSFWDSAALDWGNDVQNILIEKDPTYEQYAAYLMAKPEYQPATLAATYGWANDATGANPSAGVIKPGSNFYTSMNTWISESRDIAALAYDRVPTRGMTLTQADWDSYQKWAATIAKARAIYSGYRMGALWDTMLSTEYLGAVVPRYQPPCGQLDLGTGIDTSECYGLPYHGTNPIPGYQQVGSTCAVKCKTGTLATATYTCTAQSTGGSIWVGTPPSCTVVPPPANRCNAGVYGFIPAPGVRPAPVSLTYCPPKRVGNKVVYASKMAVLCSASLQVSFQCTY